VAKSKKQQVSAVFRVVEGACISLIGTKGRSRFMTALGKAGLASDVRTVIWRGGTLIGDVAGLVADNISDPDSIMTDILGLAPNVGGLIESIKDLRD